MKRVMLVGLGTLSILFGLLTINVASASAHRSGCHRWHSCPSDTGSYVCGDLGYTSECPDVSEQSTPVAPAKPVVTEAEVTEDQPLAFNTRTEYDSHEYDDYSKVKTEGQNGVKRNHAKVTYNDGKEVSRLFLKTEIASVATDKIIVKGIRIRPQAKLTGIGKTKKKDKYDVWGQYSPNAEVVLAVNGKKIKRAKTDSKGNFTFRGIKLTGTPILEVHKRVKGKENQVSEKTKANLSNGELTTEYASLHKS